MPHGGAPWGEGWLIGRRTPPPPRMDKGPKAEKETPWFAGGPLSHLAKLCSVSTVTGGLVSVRWAESEHKWAEEA